MVASEEGRLRERRLEELTAGKQPAPEGLYAPPVPWDGSRGIWGSSQKLVGNAGSLAFDVSLRVTSCLWAEKICVWGLKLCGCPRGWGGAADGNGRLCSAPALFSPGRFLPECVGLSLLPVLTLSVASSETSG